MHTNGIPTYTYICRKIPKAGWVYSISSYDPFRIKLFQGIILLVR